MAGSSSCNRLVLILDLIFDVASFNLQEEMLAFETDKVVTFLLVKVNCEQDFKVSCSHTDMC